MLALLALLGSAHAADVLLVDATPVTLDDFDVAAQFYGMVAAAAKEEGLSFDDVKAIRAWAGEDADTCWDVEACPANLWGRTDARLAVVLSVGQSPTGLEVAARLHGVDDPTPFKLIRETITPGKEQAFARIIARAARDSLPLLPKRGPAAGAEEPAVVAADKPVVADKPVAADKPVPADKPVAAAEKPPAPPSAAPPAADERRQMGIPAKAYARYQASGLTRTEWLKTNRIRSGHAFFELSGGYGLGDVDRGYGVRLLLEQQQDQSFTTLATSAWEGPGSGGAPTFGFALGYAPSWFLDTSIAVSMQYGTKYLDSGWACSTSCDPMSSEYDHDPVSAVQFLVEPRLRLYPVATGVVKPYALVGFSVLLHDGFKVPDPEGVDYPNAGSGGSPGPTVGVGIGFDLLSRLTLFAEVPATLLLTPPRTVADGDVGLEPHGLSSDGYVVRFVGGLGIRL